MNMANQLALQMMSKRALKRTLAVRRLKMIVKVRKDVDNVADLYVWAELICGKTLKVKISKHSLFMPLLFGSWYAYLMSETANSIETHKTKCKKCRKEKLDGPFFH